MGNAVWFVVTVGVAALAGVATSLAMRPIRLARLAEKLARTGCLKALVAIEVSFEAIEGGGMEEVEAVSTIRAATAEFLYDTNRWVTEGRVYFNLLPTATVKYLGSDLELVAEEHGGSRG